MAKQTITQRSFVIGEPREEFLEADDLDLRLASLRTARNVRVKATRTIDQKMGSVFKGVLTADLPFYEIQPASGVVYAIAIRDNGFSIYDSDGIEVSGLITSFDFGDPQKIWVTGFGPDVLIGTENGICTLRFSSDGSWVFSETFDFAEAPGQQLAQPYWSYVQGITMTPSALTGAITLTASADFFTSQYVGLRVRYGYREILITGYTSPTVVSGTVQSRLPPTYRLTLTTATNFEVGDPVVGQDTGFEGLIVAKAGSDIDVVTLRFLDGPDVGEKIGGPSATSDVTAKSSITPAASPIWDEPLMSSVRGWPRSGTSAGGRLVLADFPQAPDVIAASSVRDIFDFLVGDEDDDAIVRAIGENKPRFLHVVNAGDLLLLADRGIYMVELRGNTALTPATFVPRLVDARGSSTVRPALVDDGLIFLEASGQAIAVALLDGNIYLKWSVRTISTFHSHLISSPVTMCGPPPNSAIPEKYLFVVNDDGTMAVMSWVDGFDPDNVGFVRWDTDGLYKRVSPVFGKYWATVEREVDTTRTFFEEFDPDVFVDCAISISAIDPIMFVGRSMSICGAGWYAGEQVIGAGGTVEGDFPADAVVGLNYESIAGLWPQEQVNHPKAGVLAARVIRVGVSVLHTGPFAIRCNNITQRFGGYSFGADLSDPPPPATKLYRCSVIGRRDHPVIEIVKETPGLFQILAASQEVTF